MAKYKTRPSEVDARQYTGGEKNGKTLEAWVNSLGGAAAYSRENELPGIKLPEQFHLSISKMHMSWNLEIGDWLVYHENFITIYSNTNFQAKFEKA